MNMRRLKRIVKRIWYPIFCRFSSNSRVFSEIYRHKRWGDRSDLPFDSGLGSIDKFTEPYIQVLTKFIQENQIKSVVDLGCGNFRVGEKLIQSNDKITYIGIDVVDDLIKYLNQTYSKTDVIKFEKRDITKDKLPFADLILIRQVFQHLSNRDIKKAINNLPKNSMLIVSEHQPIEEKNIMYNKDITRGSGIRIYQQSGVYLNKPPFNLPIKKLLQCNLNENECIRTFQVMR